MQSHMRAHVDFVSDYEHDGDFVFDDAFCF